jgi:hypothetical protein
MGDQRCNSAQDHAVDQLLPKKQEQATGPACCNEPQAPTEDRVPRLDARLQPANAPHEGQRELEPKPREHS